MKQSGTFFVKGEKIVLKRDGTWIADGVEITHEQTREVFFRSIHWDEKGDDTGKHYCLKIGYETMFIEVEDTPFFVTTISHEGSKILASVTDGHEIQIKPQNISYKNESLYLQVGNNQKARFLSPAFYEILKELQEDKSSYYLTIEGQKVILAKKDEKTASRPGALKRQK